MVAAIMDNKEQTLIVTTYLEIRSPDQLRAKRGDERFQMGRKRLREETEGWNRLAKAIATALAAKPQEA